MIDKNLLEAFASQEDAIPEIEPEFIWEAKDGEKATLHNAPAVMTAAYNGEDGDARNQEDCNGNLQPVPANALAGQGYEVIRSEIPDGGSSEDFSNQAWEAYGDSSVSDSNTLNFPSEGGYIQCLVLGAIKAGHVATESVLLSGVGTIRLRIARYGAAAFESTSKQVTLTSTPTPYSVSHTFSADQEGVRFEIFRSTGDTATTVIANEFFPENLTGHPTPTIPHEYVSKGVHVGVALAQAGNYGVPASSTTIMSSLTDDSFSATAGAGSNRIYLNFTTIKGATYTYKDSVSNNGSAVYRYLRDGVNGGGATFATTSGSDSVVKFVALSATTTTLFDGTTGNDYDMGSISLETFSHGFGGDGYKLLDRYNANTVDANGVVTYNQGALIPKSICMGIVQSSGFTELGGSTDFKLWSDQELITYEPDGTITITDGDALAIRNTYKTSAISLSTASVYVKFTIPIKTSQSATLAILKMRLFGGTEQDFSIFFNEFSGSATERNPAGSIVGVSKKGESWVVVLEVQGNNTNGYVATHVYPSAATTATNSSVAANLQGSFSIKSCETYQDNYSIIPIPNDTGSPLVVLPDRGMTLPEGAHPADDSAVSYEIIFGLANAKSDGTSKELLTLNGTSSSFITRAGNHGKIGALIGGNYKNIGGTLISGRLARLRHVSAAGKFQGGLNGVGGPDQDYIGYLKDQAVKICETYNGTAVFSAIRIYHRDMTIPWAEATYDLVNPTASNVNINAVEDTAYTSTQSLLASANDPFDEPLSVVANSATTANGGAFAVDIAGDYTYSPAINYFGLDPVEYAITNGELTDTKLVVFDVLAVNDDPNAINDTYTATKNQSMALDLMQNDTDPDGDALNIKTLSGVTITNAVQSIPVPNGAVITNDGTLFSFVPAPNFEGISNFAYVIEDTGGLTSSANATINITPNGQPLAVPDYEYLWTEAINRVVDGSVANKNWNQPSSTQGLWGHRAQYPSQVDSYADSLPGFTGPSGEPAYYFMQIDYGMTNVTPRSVGSKTVRHYTDFGAGSAPTFSGKRAETHIHCDQDFIDLEEGDTLWMGWSEMYTKLDETHWITVLQLRSQPYDTTLAERGATPSEIATLDAAGFLDGGPSTALELKPGANGIYYFWQIREGTPISYSTPSNRVHTSANPIVVGQWYDIIMKHKYSKNGDGEHKVWMHAATPGVDVNYSVNDTPEWEFNGSNMYNYPNGYSFKIPRIELRCGIYRWGQDNESHTEATRYVVKHTGPMRFHKAAGDEGFDLVKPRK